MRIPLVTAVVAAVSFAAPAKAVEFIFSAVGSGSTTIQGVSSSYPAFATGSVHFDPIPGAASFTQTYFSGAFISVTGNVSDNTLTLNYGVMAGPGNQAYQEHLGLTLNFQPGYLTGIFPTSVDFAYLTSGQVGYSQSIAASATTMTFNGAVLALSSNQAPAPNPFAVITITPNVPEPATWAMMMVGFGATGAALRRRRAMVTFA